MTDTNETELKAVLVRLRASATKVNRAIANFRMAVTQAEDDIKSLHKAIAEFERMAD